MLQERAYLLHSSAQVTLTKFKGNKKSKLKFDHPKGTSNVQNKSIGKGRGRGNRMMKNT